MQIVFQSSFWSRCWAVITLSKIIFFNRLRSCICSCSPMFRRVGHWKPDLSIIKFWYDSIKYLPSGRSLCICHHHVMEPIVRAAYEKTPVRTSTGPEILLFKRFKHKIYWQFVDLDNLRAARKAAETLLDQFYSRILEFAKKHLELEEPRNDYREFLELSAFISQRCSWSCNSNASFHASGTLDGQSYLRDKDVLVP